MTFDQIREQNPDLGFALYALTPRGVVTLEILTPDGEVYAFTGLSADDVIAQAFPQPAPAEDIFS